MRDKLKGLAVGLLIGSLVTGSMAYAASSKTISVILQDLKFKIDGTDKPSASTTGFIYKDALYVPVNSVAGALGKPVKFDKKTGLVSIGASEIAIYKGGTITPKEYETFVAANSFYYGQSAPTDQELGVKQLIALKLLAAKKEATLAKEADSAAASALLQISAYFGSVEEFSKQLKSSKLTQAELMLFIKRQFLAGKALESKIDNKTLQAEYDRQRKEDSAAFVTASVRHILIATTDNQTGESIRKIEDALVRAKEVQAKLKAGGDFTALAKEYSDDPGSKDTGGLYADADLTQFVEAFKKAGAELPLNQISDPVQTEYGYHVMKVESRVVHTLDEVKDQLLPSLVNQAYENYTNKELPALIQSIKIPAK
ncbi:peptidylprolyl isomerase [Cohnella mopanensis]|uniref:peptidylprolyl isomerase n=1 Tax=Cohnella mopanensis TaxID=2911966 RepID=UPI001EF83BD2|nr:peptidylprolyl isomerase [Cohnella mopanensis]